MRLLEDQEKSILNLEKITENQAIFSDAFTERANRVFISKYIGKYNEYRDKDDGSIFRINILHPNPSEAITGADLIYEQYHVSRQKVRIAAIQYKIWEKGVLYITTSGNILKQINKMKSCFCDDDFCRSNGRENEEDIFRFPYCAAFLRPTDKLQNPNKLITSGYHVPVCCLKNLQKTGAIDYKIDFDTIKHVSVKAQTFEELFNSEMIGSDWLDINDLETFYQNSKILEPNKRIILYAQSAVNENSNPF